MLTVSIFSFKGGGGVCIFTNFFRLDVVVTALFLVYMRFVIRGHVWNILQEHFYALDWACLTRGTVTV